MKSHSSLSSTLILLFLSINYCAAIVGLIACPTIRDKLENLYFQKKGVCKKCSTWATPQNGVGVRAVCKDRRCAAANVSCVYHEVNLGVYLLGGKTTLCTTMEPLGPDGAGKTGPLCTTFLFPLDGQLFKYQDANECSSTYAGVPCAACVVKDGMFPLPLPGTYVSGCTQGRELQFEHEHAHAFV